jgi:BirA family transcriptional regulator, biotin operon repressor / biotin---[acetyl-CoA-carboxylase] ligase
MDIDTAAARAGVGHIAHEVVASTNAEALALAHAGERGPLWVTARAQTAGRGRRGRDWVSKPGNLFATLLLADPCDGERAPQLSFVAALGLHDAVAEIAPALGPRLGLKWPNDALCDALKFAGILIEGEGSGAAFTVAVGIGVNCAHHPAGTEYPATDLAAAGAVVTADMMFRALSRTMLARLAQWDRGDGFAAIRTDWLKRAAGLGGPVRVRLGDRTIEGRFEALDAAGRLIVRRADGAAEAVSSGDVFPLHVAASAAEV